jgi:HTH-type transcriptional regulator/antitoxin HigA
LTESGAITTLLSNALLQPLKLTELYEAKLEATGLKNYQVAKLLGMDRNSLDPIINGTAKQPNLINLIKIGEFLQLDVEQMISSFLSAKSGKEMGDLEKTRKVAFVASHFDLPRLKEVGFLERVDDINHIEQRLCTYFSIPNVFAYANIQSTILFSRTKNPYDNVMIDFWMKSSYGYFEQLQNDNPYDRDVLKNIIPKIRPYTRNVKQGLFTVIKALYNAGVTVIFQKHLSKTQIRGATIIVNEKPCIVITDLRKNYATIWFALVHELHHVLYDLNIVRDTAFHLTGEPDLFLIEERANEFAQEILFPKEKLRYIAPMIHNELVVRQYAEQNGVHPSIIYSFYQYEMEKQGKNFYGAFQDQFPDISTISERLNINLWSEESIQHSVEKIKTTFELT